MPVMEEQTQKRSQRVVNNRSISVKLWTSCEPASVNNTNNIDGSLADDRFIEALLCNCYYCNLYGPASAARPGPARYTSGPARPGPWPTFFYLGLAWLGPRAARPVQISGSQHKACKLFPRINFVCPHEACKFWRINFVLICKFWRINFVICYQLNSSLNDFHSDSQLSSWNEASKPRHNTIPVFIYMFVSPQESTKNGY